MFLEGSSMIILIRFASLGLELRLGFIEICKIIFKLELDDTETS